MVRLGLGVRRKHCLVQAPGPGQAAVFLTFSVLAQGEGVYVDLAVVKCAKMH